MGKFLHAFFGPLGLRRAVPQVWDGFQTNIKLMVIAEILVLVLALVVAIVRGLPGRWSLPLRGLAIAYTDFFRGTPIILVAYVIALGLPSLQLAVISSQSLFVYGIASLTLVYTAYVTEVYRAGIESVHPSQRMAARSLGLSLRADDDARHPAAGDPACRPAAPERLHRLAEGHGDHHGDRAHRGDRAGRASTRTTSSRTPATWWPRSSS